MRRNLSSNDEQLMITTARADIGFQSDFSNRNSTLGQSEQKKIPKFYSRNLQQRMNEYLNLVVAKSSQDHQERLKKIKND